jgi:hypothetical protein
MLYYHTVITFVTIKAARRAGGWRHGSVSVSQASAALLCYDARASTVPEWIAGYGWKLLEGVQVSA